MLRLIQGVAYVFSYKPPPARLRPTAWLDGLRGVAALEVVIYHYAELWGSIDVGYGSRGLESQTLLRLPLVRALYDSGAAMVCLFFIISGLVLTQRVLRALNKAELLEAYSILSSSIFRRGLRLFPPAVCSAFVAFLLFRIFQIRPYGAHPTIVPYYDSFFIQLYDWIIETIRYVNPFDSNLRDAWTVVDAKVRFLGHAYANVIWTIPVEYYGSMACYLQLIATARLAVKQRIFILAIIAIWGLLVSRWILFCFNAGILLGQWLLDQPPSKKVPETNSRIFLWSLGLFAGIFLAGSPDRGAGPGANPSLGYNTIWRLIPEAVFDLNFNYTVWSVAGLLIATSASQLPRVRSLLESGVCQYLGKISFSMYLLHIIVRDTFGEWLQKTLAYHTRRQNTSSAANSDDGSIDSWMMLYLACIMWYIIMMTLVFIFSGVFERFVDAPLISFSKWFEGRLLPSKDTREQVTLHELEAQSQGN